MHLKFKERTLAVLLVVSLAVCVTSVVVTVICIALERELELQ